VSVGVTSFFRLGGGALFLVERCSRSMRFPSVALVSFLFVFSPRGLSSLLFRPLPPEWIEFSMRPVADSVRWLFGALGGRSLVFSYRSSFGVVLIS